MLRSPVLEKIKVLIFSCDANDIIPNIKEEFGWFKELVEGVGVRLCCVDKSQGAAYDSSDGEYFESSEDSVPLMTDGEDDEWEDAEGALQLIQCAQN